MTSMRVSPLILKVLAYTLDVEGFDASSALKRCGLTLAQLSDESGEWVSVDLYDQLVRAVLEETGDPLFGLVAGKSLALTRFDIITPLSLFTPHLRQLFKDILRFTPLVLDRSEFLLEESPDTARLIIKPIVQHGPGGRFRQEFLATSVLQMLRLAGIDSSDLHWVDFPYACTPDMRVRYAKAFGPRIRFEQSDCGVCFNPGWLDTPLLTHDPMAYTTARTRAESALAAQHMQIDTAERVRQWLLAALPHQPSITQVAQHLGMSERSLRRNLSALGTSHQELTQACQDLKARQLLAEGKLSIKQVADGLGFSSVTSFHRAFKRWTGSTPLSWLETQRQGSRSG
jgi:AraC-like DNA-binding protein